MARTAEIAHAEFVEAEKMVSMLHPETDEEKLLYRKYRIAYYLKPDYMLPCHICLVDQPKGPPMYVKDSDMTGHCKLKHRKAQIICGYNKCVVMFSTTEEKEKHSLYVHEKPYGWWIPPQGS